MKTSAIRGSSPPLAGLRETERLSLEDEKRLALQVKDGSDEALRQLVESNLAYVVKIALEYCSFGLPLDDLVSEGSIGLIEAARRYDPEKKVRFISYATWWIRKSMLRALSRQIRIVHVPWYQSKNYQRIIEARKKLRESLGRHPTEDELSKEVALSGRVIKRSLRNQRREVSLDAPPTPGTTIDLKEYLPGDDGSRAEDDLIRRDMARTIRRLLRGLNRRQRMVLWLRFGMHGGAGMKLRQIGEVLGLSRERVRQIESEALDRLRELIGNNGSCGLRTGKPRARGKEASIERSSE